MIQRPFLLLFITLCTLTLSNPMTVMDVKNSPIPFAGMKLSELEQQALKSIWFPKMVGIKSEQDF